MRLANPFARFILAQALVLAFSLVAVSCQDLTTTSEATGTTEQATTSTTASASTSTTQAKVPMPKLVGLPEADARAQLEALGLTYDIKSVPTLSSAKRGKVTAQDIADGTELAVGTRVTISVGHTGVEVPGCEGLPDYDAKGWLESLGLKVKLTYVPPRDATTPALYSVTSQSPSEGTVVLKGSTVKLTVKPEF
jgi:beta-lactam-binding protein with PASTA domain